jgi:hypothetical protein
MVLVALIYTRGNWRCQFLRFEFAFTLREVFSQSN